MDVAGSQLKTLLELDARHDDLLQQLAELDQRVTRVLTECRSLDARPPQADVQPQP